MEEIDEVMVDVTSVVEFDYFGLFLYCAVDYADY